MTELYYKGIYPVEVVPDVSVDSDRQELTVRAKSRFLHTSNYSDETRIVKPGEELTVLARLVWDHKRGVPTGVGKKRKRRRKKP